VPKSTPNARWENGMNHRERFVRTLTGREVDRVPFIKVFGGDNAIVPGWEKDCPGIGRSIDRVLGFDGEYRGWQIAPVNFWLSNVPPERTLEKTGSRSIVRLGDGRIAVCDATSDFNYHIIEYPVKTRADWERMKSEHMDPDDPARFAPEWPAFVERRRSREVPLQLTHAGVYGFARRCMGDEALAYAFYDDPEMVRDIMTAYTGMALAIWEKMVRELPFDLIECWEDMASKNGSLISPAMFREFMAPQYRRIRAFADAHEIEIVLVDSDGLIEDLTALMLEAGVTALYPFEVQSGNDVAKMLDRHATLGVIGGLDKRVMSKGRDAIDREMERARSLIRKGRFIPGPDHFVLSDVSWPNYRYFMERLREVVMTTVPGVRKG
jgi:uroporphyrinogen decarboxylase